MKEKNWMCYNNPLEFYLHALFGLGINHGVNIHDELVN